MSVYHAFNHILCRDLKVCDGGRVLDQFANISASIPTLYNSESYGPNQNYFPECEA